MSKVFIYLANHGANGLLAFPLRDYLYANEFVEALKLMHDKGLYGEMVIYLEGSQTGSIFRDLLPKDIKILGFSATDHAQTSFATYCYPNDFISEARGKEGHIGVCLGDIYSVSFLEDAERSDPSRETLETQIKRVQALTKNYQ